MKHLLFVCAGLADEGLEDLGGRTPLEAAKTPVMDALAQKGRLGQACFVPPSLEPTPEVAVLSILGYDPLKYYTGLAPLEAPAFGIHGDDRMVVFRADLVTLFDDALMDPSSGYISEREAGILINCLSTHFKSEKYQFLRGSGYKNYLLVRDETLAEDLDDLDTIPPSQWLGQKVGKHLPRGRGHEFVISLMKEASAFLENHEINRVRIDLGENPANRLWLWGQGKKPRLPLFEKQYALSGAFHAAADFVRGIGSLTGLAPAKETQKTAADFELFYSGGGSESSGWEDLKTKIKRIEEFDSFVGSTLKAQTEAFRVAVTGDVTGSLAQKKALRNACPILISGEGVFAEKNTAFNEKLCAQSAPLEKSFEFLNSFLKK